MPALAPSDGSRELQDPRCPLAPGFLTETLGATHGDFAPAARVRDLDQTVHHLSILTRRGQPAAKVLKGGRAIWEEESITVLDKPIAYGVRHGPGIGLSPVGVPRGRPCPRAWRRIVL